MTEQHWWKVAATGLTVAAGVGIAAAALYGVYNESQNSQNQLQLEYYDFSRTNRNQNQPRNGRPSNEGNDDFSSENRRKQLERQEKLIKLREERQKQLENDQRIKNEEEKLRKTREMESILESFDDAFDEEIGVRTKIEYDDDDFDDFKNNKSKQQRKEEYRRKQHAKNQKSQNDKEEMNKLNNVNVVMRTTNKSCDTRKSQSTYLNQGINSSRNISQELEESDD